MNITVYLGAKEGNDPALKRAVQELGQWIGQSGNALVYGGSKTGLMGEIAKSVLDAGGAAGSYDRNRAFDKRAAGRNLVCGEPGADQADSESIKTPKYHRTPHST